MTTTPQNNKQNALLDALGLYQNPFPVVPDGQNFFFTPKLETSITELFHGICTRKGFLLLTGEVGLGKTTISRRLLHTLEKEHVETSLVFNTFLQDNELLSAINKDFGIECSSNALEENINALSSHLVDRYTQGINCAILIDDAQNLSTSSLELIRLISNLETNSEKMVQILLIGQPELHDVLDKHELRQLRSRVVVDIRIDPLDQNSLEQYIIFKLNSAGSEGRIRVAPEATSLIYNTTKGNPRRTNILMDRCMYGLVLYKRQELDSSIVQEAISDLGWEGSNVSSSTPTQQSKKPSTPAILMFSLFVAFGVIGFLATQYNTKDNQQNGIQQKAKVQSKLTLEQQQKLASLEELENKLNKRLESLQAQNSLQLEVLSADNTELKKQLERSQQELKETQKELEHNKAVENHRTNKQPQQTNSSTPHNDVISKKLNAKLDKLQLRDYKDDFRHAIQNNDFSSLNSLLKSTEFKVVNFINAPEWHATKFESVSYQDNQQRHNTLLFWQPTAFVDNYSQAQSDKTLAFLQSKLAKLGFYDDDISTEMNQQTITAVSRFQKANQLPVTGQPDVKTQFYLEYLSLDVFTGWVIQVGSFEVMTRAQKLKAELAKHNIDGRISVLADEEDIWWYAVRIGPWKDYDQAKQQLDVLQKQFGVDGFILNSKPVNLSTVSNSQQ